MERRFLKSLYLSLFKLESLQPVKLWELKPMVVSWRINRLAEWHMTDGNTYSVWSLGRFIGG